MWSRSEGECGVCGDRLTYRRERKIIGVIQLWLRDIVEDGSRMWESLKGGREKERTAILLGVKVEGVKDASVYSLVDKEINNFLVEMWGKKYKLSRGT